MADGTGITQRKDSRGRVRYGVRVTYVDADGIERAYSGTFDTEKEAVTQRNKWRRLRDQRELRVPTRMTIEHYAREWLRQCQKDGLSEYTLSGYRSKLKYIIAVIGRMRLEEVKLCDVKRVHADLETLHHHRTGKPLSEETKAGVRRVLHNLLASAVDDEIITRNPATMKRKRRIKGRHDDAADDAPRKATFTAEQIVRLRGAALESDDDRLYIAVLLASETGCRRGEVLALQWRDLAIIDEPDSAPRGSLSIRRAMVWTTGSPSFEKPKTETSVRVVPLGAGVVAELDAYRRRQDARRKAAGSKWEDVSGLIITNALGHPWHPNKLSASFAELASGLGFTLTKFHALRHTFGSLLAEAHDGPSWPQLAALMGHSRTTTTINVYSHPVEDAAGQRAIDVLDGLYDSARKGREVVTIEASV